MKADPQAPVRILDPGDPNGLAVTSAMNDPIPGLAVINAILRNRLRILAFAAILCVIVLAYGLTRPRQFVSDASFSLQGDDSRQLSGIAAQIGLAIQSNDGSQSPAYYVELLGSREVLLSAASAEYSYSRDGKLTKGTLPEIYGIEGGDSAVRYDLAIQRLRGAISTDKSRETGIVKIHVKAPTAPLAQQILTRLLALLNDFNLRTRQSQAANERRFVEQRMSEVGRDLRGAEDRLKEFLQRNRGPFASTPDLALEHDRLVREVSLRQDVYTALSQNYEQARINEVRDTPALTVIESANTPVRPAPRGLLRKLILTLIVALTFGSLVPGIGVLLSSKRLSVEEEAAEFERLRRHLIPWKRAPFTSRFAPRES